MESSIFDLIGSAGVLSILIAYFLLQNGTWRGNHLAYPLTTMCGSIMLLISLSHDWNLSGVIINIAYIIISLIGIVRFFIAKKSS